MNASTLLERLEAACEDEDDFPYALHDLVAELPRDGAGLALVTPILEFMEQHPDLDYGPPGPLVHYMERFYGAGYDERLVESVERCPTVQTVIMLNRLINGAKDSKTGKQLVEVVQRAAIHPLAEDSARHLAEDYLERHANRF